MPNGGFVYILTSRKNTVLYVGVTSDLVKRIHEHRNRKYRGSFSARYNIDKLVYFEPFWDIRDAIAREKQLKAGSRKKKLELINSINPEWNDLSTTL